MGRERACAPTQPRPPRSPNDQLPNGIVSVLDEELVVLSTNISELRCVREALHEAKETAERASSARLALLASMSHELRTSLAGIMGLLEGDAALRERASEHLDRLRALVESARALAGRGILVVEDNEVIRLVVGELLRRDGVEVVEVVDAGGADRALAVGGSTRS